MHSRSSSDFLFSHPSLISGMARVLDLCGLFDSYNRSDEADAVALFSDWNAIGQDIESAIHSFESSVPAESKIAEQYELFVKTQ